ncbi:TolC family outer membrane protein [Litorimonas sp. RW-G-Af-16]|uniref:TolC family outer membrane protein n=1 Tax=Litorimonas sp. RW-G-Af-16 TaxID=3241168 RepID=UPI00390C50D1
MRWLLSAAIIVAPLSFAQIASAETLQDTLISVYNKNPRLQAERARLRETDETYIQARAQGRLSATASGSYARTEVRTPETPGSFFAPPGGGWRGSDPLAGQVQVIQPLYQGGRVKALKRQAKSGILAARESLRATENSIFVSAAEAYVDVLRDEQAANIRRNNVRVLTSQLTAANARFDVGEGTRTDIAQSQSRLAASEAGLAQAEAQLQISRATYKRIVGRMPVDLQPVPDFALPNDLPTAIALARDNNPQLLASYFNEEAGRAAIDVAKSNGRPTISLNGTLSAQRGQLLGIEETDQASLTAQISVPIFSGGLNRSRVRQAKHAKTRLAFETRDTELAVDQTVTQIWAQLEAAKRVFITSQQQLDAAEVAFEGVELELTVGTRTQLDVLNAEQEVLNAKLALINAERDVDSVTYQLLSILGVFDADGIALPVETYDAVQNFEAVRYRGFDRNIDRFVPEAAQKIGRQIPDIVNDVAGGVATLGRATKLDTVPETLSKAEVKPVKLLKDAADTVTGQEGEYHALRDVPLPEIVTEPIQPPSQPPRELIIDP